MYLPNSSPLIALDAAVDVLDKGQTHVEGGTAQHEEEAKGNGGHVAKVERTLEQTGHAGSVVVVEDGVDVDEDAGHTAVDKGGPPPLMVLTGQLEVQEGDGDEGRHNHEKDEGKEKDTKKGVDLMSPHGGKDVVQLDVDGRKGEEAGDDHLEGLAAVPRDLGGDLTGDLGGAGGGIEVVLAVVLGHRSTENAERDAYAHVQEGQGEDGSKGKGGSRTMSKSNGVDDHEYGSDRQREEGGGKKDASSPRLAVHLQVQIGRGISRNVRGEAVHNDASGEDRSASGRRHRSRQGQNQDSERAQHELQTRTDARAEQRRILRKTEHIAMNELPSRLLFLHGLLVQLHVPREVVLEHPHKDDGQEGRQEEDQNERVDDAQPVDLEAVGEEARVVVSGHAHLPGQILLPYPIDGVRELNLGRLMRVGNVDPTVGIGSDGSTDNVAIVGANLEVKVGEQIRLAAIHLAKQNVLVGHIADVSPHGQVLNEHLEEVGVVDGILERFELVGAEGGLAKLSPLNVVLEGNFERRRLATVAGDALAETLLVLEAGLALLPGDGIVGVVLDVIVGVAVGEGVVSVGFRRVVERSDLVDDNVDGCISYSPSGARVDQEDIDGGGRARDRGLGVRKNDGVSLRRI